MSKIDRRYFIRNTAALSTMALISPSFAFSKNEDGNQVEKWQRMMKDPVYDMIKGKPDLDQILGLFPRPQGPMAFDPRVIQTNIKKLKTVPEINTGHPFLDLSIKTSLAHIDATFQGDHPKYGVGVYGRIEHDGFPPIIIAAVDALSAWGINIRAAQLFHYWLTNFVKEDGTFDYYGPSISEYGQLLHTATILEERAGGKGWLEDGSSKLNLIAEYLLQLVSSASNEDGLISGVPEADTRDQVAKYFHNNAWAVKGLEQWVKLCEKTRSNPSTSIEIIRKASQKLKKDTLTAIRKTWPADPCDWWLPARTGEIARPRYLTIAFAELKFDSSSNKFPSSRELAKGNEASYTNYRYWPELLSSGILPEDMANRLVNARLNGGGQFCGMTRFLDWLDDWPLTDYLYALWSLGRKDDFLLGLYGHIAYHQCEGHLTAYEQMSFPGDPQGSKRADFCLPCQLVAARVGRLINKS
jgi:hypothetical protein